MKKHIFNIFKILIFIIVFIFFYCFLTVFKKPVNYKLYNVTGLYAERKNSLDMVYIGGSAAFVYYSPIDAYKNYGISSYVYAADNMQAELYTTMVKELLKTQKPKLIVIDVRAFQYRDTVNKPSEKEYRAYLTYLKPSKDRYDLINKIVPKYLNQKTDSYHFDLKLYHSSEEKSLIKTTLKVLFDKNKHPNKGFYLLAKTIKLQEQDRTTDDIRPIGKETEKLLNELLDYLEKRNIKALFVVSPYLQTKTEKMNFNYIEKIIKSRNQDFLDANDYIKEMNLNYAYDFIDIDHVNIYGAEKYTEFFTKYLVNNYNLPDRRGDKLYDEDFNNLIPKWNQNVEETKKTIKEIIARKGYEEEIQTK